MGPAAALLLSTAVAVGSAAPRDGLMRSVLAVAPGGPPAAPRDSLMRSVLAVAPGGILLRRGRA